MPNKATIDTNCIPDSRYEEFASGMMSTSEQSTVHIDISQIPDCVFEVACPILNSAIRRALRDPEKRKDYERWKAERTAKATSKKERSGRV